MPMNPRLLRPLATGFDPRTVAGLFAWYDASDSTTVTLNGSNISAIAAKAGVGPTLAQSTASLQPAYLSNGINGRGVISPDGIDDRLAAATAGYQPRYMVGAFMAISDNAGGWVTAGNAGGSGFVLGQGGGTHDGTGQNVVAVHAGVAWRASNIALTLNQPAIVSYVSTTSVFRVFPGGATADLNDVGMISGSGLTIGGDQVGANERYTDAYTGEVLIYTSVPSISEQQRIERYLGGKWGIAVT